MEPAILGEDSTILQPVCYVAASTEESQDLVLTPGYANTRRTSGGMQTTTALPSISVTSTLNTLVTPTVSPFQSARQETSREAVQISNTNPLQIMNGRSEYIRPVIQRMTHVDLLDNDNERGRRPGNN